MVIDAALPLGYIANTAAMLGVTIGSRLPQIVGEDVADATETRTPESAPIPSQCCGAAKNC